MQRRRNPRTAPPSVETIFGQVLRELRLAHGLTQESLAFASEYHPTYIGQLERGKKSPSLRTIMRLAGVLDTPGSEMLKRLEALIKTDQERD
jgi:transcriptional regulator with XRE-family HTH domain